MIWRASIAMILASCSEIGTNPISVSYKEYSKIEKCWTNEKNEFSAIIIMAETEKKSIPFVVSEKCDPIIDGYEDGRGFLGDLDAVKISGDNGILKARGLFHRSLSPNYIVDGIFPERDSRIYRFVGDISKDSVKGVDFYTISNVRIFEYLGVDFGEFSEARINRR